MTAASATATATATVPATGTARLRRAIPAQRTRTARRDALATPWSDVALPSPRRLPRATGFPSLALIELARLR